MTNEVPVYLTQLTVIAAASAAIASLLVLFLLVLIIVLLTLYLRSRKKIESILASAEAVAKNAADVSALVREEAAGIKASIDTVRGAVDDVAATAAAASSAVRTAAEQASERSKHAKEGIFAAIGRLFRK